MSERIDLKSCCDILKEMNDVLILSHKSPDGDTIGSAFSLAMILKSMGKRVSIACNDEIPTKYSYFTSKISLDNFEPKAIVSVDVADTSLLGDKLKIYADKIDLAIDHHVSHKDFANKVYLNHENGSNCENIFEIAQYLNISINKDMANAIFTGVSTDTGCFKYPNTTSKTHIIAAKLMDLGAESAFINKLMFDTKTKTKVMLEKNVLENMEYYFNDKCALTVITKEMLKNSGATDEECDGISAIPRLIEGVEVGVTVREKDNGYKLSLRSNNYVDVSKLCGKFDGGGHIRAAGCFISDNLTEVKKKILSEIEKELH